MATKIKSGVYSIISLLGVVWFLFSINIILNLKGTVEKVNLQKDSLSRVWDEKEKTYVYSISAYTAEKKKLELFLKENQKELYDLRKKYNALAAIKAKVEIKMDTILKYDSIYIDTTSGRDVRVSSIKDDFRDIGVISYPDSIHLSPFIIKTGQTIVVGEDGKVRVLFTNPYMQVTDLNSYYIQPPKQKKKNWKFWVGLGIGLAGGLYLP